MMGLGFTRLRPAKTKEEEDAEQVLRDFEAGKYGKNEPEKPKEPEKPPVKPPEEDELDKEIRRQEALRKKLRQYPGGAPLEKK